MDIVERLKILIKLECDTQKTFCGVTGMDGNRLKNVFSGRAQVRHDEIVLIEQQWPEYGYWLAFGKELVDCGQVSPMRKLIKKEA